MKFRFIGTYTNGHASISILGHEFVGREATEVSPEAAERLLRHVEFEVVKAEFTANTRFYNGTMVDEVSSIPETSNSDQPVKRRGRPRKVS